MATGPRAPRRPPRSGVTSPGRRRAAHARCTPPISASSPVRPFRAPSALPCRLEPHTCASTIRSRWTTTRAISTTAVSSNTVRTGVLPGPTPSPCPGLPSTATTPRCNRASAIRSLAGRRSRVPAPATRRRGSTSALSAGTTSSSGSVSGVTTPFPTRGGSSTTSSSTPVAPRWFRLLRRVLLPLVVISRLV